MKSRSYNSHHRFFICTCILLVLLIVLVGILYVKQYSPQQLLAYFGVISIPEKTDYTLVSWERSLTQLNYDADIVFIGDSLTSSVDFQSSFPDKKIINLGLSGDSLDGIHRRSSIIPHFSPEMIFVEGGVNSLNSLSLDDLVSNYSTMIDEIIQTNPVSKIYIQSILPISNSRENKNLTNKNILSMNAKLLEIANKYGAVFVDLFSVYASSGEMNPSYTTDGIHLTEESKQLWINALVPYINN